jgi:outer membrane protein assembly factor BamB
MKFRFGGAAACMLALTLAACGGGGGGGSGGSAAGPAAGNPEGNWLSFDPTVPSVTQYEGESMPFNVTANASRTFTAPFNLAIIDATGVITNQVALSSNSQTSYTAALHTAATLSAGTHTTTLEVRVCEDAPLTCAKPFPGSPWRLPLTVQVKPKAEAAARLTLSVPSLNVTTYPGEAASFGFEAQLNKELASRVVSMGIFDPNSITVVPPTRMTTEADGHYTFTLSSATSNALAAGTYTSNLQLRLCYDDIVNCRQPVAGSPWIIPLTLTVKQPTNLTALKAIDGLGGWSTWQGNAAHTGFVDASFDPAAFTRRWRMAAVNNYNSPYASAAIDGNRIFFVRHDSAGKWELVAVSEDTGELAWRAAMGSLYQVNPPAASNGRVYLTSSGHEDSYMWVFDQATGAQIRKLAMTSQWPHYSAPTVLGSDVYSIDGYVGGIARYADQRGQFDWRVGASIEEGWSPAADGAYLYTFSTPDNNFLAFNAANGTLAYSVGAPYNFSTYFTAQQVILTDTRQAVVSYGKLMAFDLANHTRSWILNTPTSGNAAYGNGVVYAFGANGRTLEAHAPSTGDLLWTSADLGANGYGDIVVTRNLAFVSSGTTTLAVDLNTHKTVWSYPLGGSMAISPRGVLYILTNVGGLAAVNLR